MFTEEQIKALQAPLDKANVKSRSQAGRSLSYIEGWKAIEEANRIFGFDAWDRETVELRQLAEREVDGKYRVAYMARVRITIHTQPNAEGAWATIQRDGCGYGSGIDRDLGSAHESAIKEAETDAMKRALMTFGNPFGLALYDKEQRNVSDETPQAAKPRSPVNTPLPAEIEPDPQTRANVLIADTLIAALKCAQTVEALETWGRSDATQVQIGDLPTSEAARVRAAFKLHKDKLLQKEAA